MAKKQPAAKPATPDTPPAKASAPAPEQTQKLAGAGEMQGFNALRITAAREGFRRAGRAWSKTPVDVPLADLTDDQVALLRAESLLTVEDITIEAAE